MIPLLATVLLAGFICGTALWMLHDPVYALLLSVPAAGGAGVLVHMISERERP